MLKPTTYDDMWSQKTAKKNCLKESNISMKKYHHSPTLGVRSDNVSWTPYVDTRKSHESVTRYETPSIASNAIMKPAINFR